MYLAAVIDLFSRQLVGWRLQPHMQTSLAPILFRYEAPESADVAGAVCRHDGAR